MTGAPHAGTPLVLGGREFRLRFDFNALARIEEVTGRSTLDQQTFKTPRATDLRAMVWAGLLHEHPELTLDEVGALIPLGAALADVANQVVDAWAAAMPTKDKKSAGRAVPLAERSEAAG